MSDVLHSPHGMAQDGSPRVRHPPGATQQSSEQPVRCGSTAGGLTGQQQAVLWLREAQLTLWHDQQGHRAPRGVTSALGNGVCHGRAATSIPAVQKGGWLAILASTLGVSLETLFKSETFRLLGFLQCLLQWAVTAVL